LFPVALVPILKYLCSRPYQHRQKANRLHLI
jgi:hypothetical protein